MDCGSVAAERAERPPGRRRLLLLLAAGRGGGPGGRSVPARRLPPALPGGLGALRPCAPVARGGAYRASPRLLLLLAPSPRLAAAFAPRRPLAERERERAGPSAAPSWRSGAWRCLPGLAPGAACAAGALHPCLGPAAALASCRRGFTTQQAEIIVSALVKIMETNMDIVYKDMVTKMQQEITLQQIMSQIANVKKDMVILEKSEFSALRSENEKIKLELHRLKQQVMDEAIKVQTDTKLDFNLEKSRVKELYSLNERKLLEIKTEMVSLHAQQDRAITQTDRKIDTEVAGLKTMLESHKLDNIKYLAGCQVPQWRSPKFGKKGLTQTSQLTGICL
ncbi:mitochondrial calcium uniporter regulator 1 isoform X2 [Hippopotamus amphibius kiboko]|uniref:mitochondrial calcium uniporter regulator 1 isoform X2 n=1 Tax=Hippopotamus amphibius kiboko TaxID=575201 RepID=UPI00259552A8|nr:mitochondrial calcium uniporter regulator 1 isoform X2 [Hippopotamus amphibius kiboko]